MENMANMIKVGGITYRVTYVSGKLEGHECIMRASKGKEIDCLHEVSNMETSQYVKRTFGEEVDDIQVWERNNDLEQSEICIYL